MVAVSWGVWGKLCVRHIAEARNGVSGVRAAAAGDRLRDAAWREARHALVQGYAARAAGSLLGVSA